MPESPIVRRKRLEQHPPYEAVATLLASIDNGIDREIATAAESRLWDLVMIGIHAVALTVSEALCNKRGEDGYAWYVQTCLDPKSGDPKYSQIAGKLHDWRNVLAHQWLSCMGHEFGLDENLQKTWEQWDGILWVNPRKYWEAYSDSIAELELDIENIFTADELEAARKRIVKKYLGR